MPGVALAVGIDAYADPALPDLPAVRREVEVVSEALRDNGFTVRPGLVGQVGRAEVLDCLATVDVSPGQELLLYWTGHGTGGALFTGDGPIEAAELAAVVDRLPARRILVILDCCAAGTTALDIASAMYLARRAAPPPGGSAPAVTFITATYGDQEAEQLRFAEACAAALRHGPPATAWPAQLARVTPQQFADAADEWLHKLGGRGVQRIRSVGLEAGTPFFRNPRHDPRVRDVVLDGRALVRRDAVLDFVAGWTSRGAGGLLLITGAPGTGKSTVVRQLAEGAVALPGAVSVNLAGGRALEHLLAALTANLGPGYERATTVLVDSLDEAAPADRQAIVARVLLPLSRRPGVQVVVTARGDADEATAAVRRAASATYDLDADPGAAAEITRHVTRTLLSTPSSPFADRPDGAELAGAVAREVAAHSAGVFLFADLVAATLAREFDPVLPGSDALRAVLRAGIDEAIRGDLARAGDRPGLVMAVLTPLAWAHGGIPRRPLWPALATALAGTEVTDDDVTWVLTVAGSYVSASVEDGRTVYRPRHHAFTEYLRAQTGTGPVDVQRRITGALRQTVRDWADADRYVLAHLATHAEAAGLLGPLLDDPGFLTHGDSRTILPAVARRPRRRLSELAGRYLRAGPLLHGAEPPARAFALGLPSAGPRLLWDTAPRPAPHRLIRAGAEGVTALAAAVAGGRRLLAAGTGDTGAVELWDADTAEIRFRLSRPEPAGLLSMAASGPVLVAAYDDGVLQGWSLERREALWSRDVSDHIIRIAVVDTGGVRAMATSGGGAGPVRLWRPDDGVLLHTLGANGGALFTVGFAAGDRRVLCVGTSTGNLDFFDADTFTPIGELVPDEVWLDAVTAVRRGRLVLIGSRGDGRLETRDALDGRVLALSREEADEGAERICALPVGDDAVVVAPDDMLLRVWDGAGGGSFLAGHRGGVEELAVLPDPGGEHAIASASLDGTIRVWSPMAGNGGGGAGPRYSSCFSVVAQGRPAVIVESYDEAALLDLQDGSTRRTFVVPWREAGGGTVRRGEIAAVATLPEDVLALTHHDGGAQWMRSVLTDREYTVDTRPYHGADVEVVVVDGPDGLVLVVGDGAAPVTVYDFAARPVSELRDSAGGVPVAASATRVVVRFPDRFVVYDPTSGEPLVAAAMPGRGGRVLAATRRGPLMLVVRSGDAGTLLWPIEDEGQPLPLGRDVVCATAVDVGGEEVLALGTGTTVVVLRPGAGWPLCRLPFAGRIDGLTACGAGRLAVRVGGTVMLLAIDALPQGGNGGPGRAEGGRTSPS